MTKDAVLSIRLTPRLKREFKQLAIEMDCTYFELLQIMVGVMQAKRSREISLLRGSVAEPPQTAWDAHDKAMRELETRLESARELDRKLGELKR